MKKRKLYFRSREEWGKIVTGQIKSGKSALSYCRTYNIPLSSFSYWKKRYNQNETFQKNKNNNFIKLSNVSVQSPQTLKIQTPAGYQIEFRERTSPEILTNILKAISVL